MNQFASKTIGVLHIIIIAYFVIGPYVKWNVDLPLRQIVPTKLPSALNGLTLMDSLYIISAISLITHWLLNSDVCMLTELESVFRGTGASKDSFLKRLIQPIYIIDDKHIKHLSYSVLLFNVGYLLFSRRQT